MRLKCRELLAASAAAVGLADLPEPDADGVCRVSDGRVTFGFAELEETLLVEARACALPEQGRTRFLSALLRANFLGQGARGGALTVSDDDWVVLFRRFPLEGLTPEALTEEFEAFAAIVFEWRRLAEAYQPLAEQQALEIAREHVPQSFQEGFLRV